MRNTIYQYTPYEQINSSSPASSVQYSFTSPALFGVTINEKDFMQEENYSFYVRQGNNIQTIQLGRTGMYQINKPITGSVIFPVDTPQNVKLDIIYQIQE